MYRRAVVSYRYDDVRLDARKRKSSNMEGTSPRVSVESDVGSMHRYIDAQVHRREARRRPLDARAAISRGFSVPLAIGAIALRTSNGSASGSSGFAGMSATRILSSSFSSSRSTREIPGRFLTPLERSSPEDVLVNGTLVDLTTITYITLWLNNYRQDSLPALLLQYALRPPCLSRTCVCMRVCVCLCTYVRV